MQEKKDALIASLNAQLVVYSDADNVQKEEFKQTIAEVRKWTKTVQNEYLVLERFRFLHYHRCPNTTDLPL